MASRVREIRSLVQAAATGSQLDQLKALRNRLAVVIEDEKTRPRRDAHLRSYSGGVISFGHTSEVGVRPGADDAGRSRGLVLPGEQVVGTFERDEVAGMPGSPEDLARVRDADGVVGGRMQHHQCPAQGSDPLAQIGGAHVLDEVPFECERLTADEERCLSVGLDAMHQCVVVVLDVSGLVGRPDTGHRLHSWTFMRSSDRRWLGKDCPAASRMCKQLAGEGIGMLRFDNLGLGHSEGDWGDGSFSHKVEDTVRAVEFMNESDREVRLLVGHSFGAATLTE